MYINDILYPKWWAVLIEPVITVCGGTCAELTARRKFS